MGDRVTVLKFYDRPLIAHHGINTHGDERDAEGDHKQDDHHFDEKDGGLTVSPHDSPPWPATWGET